MKTLTNALLLSLFFTFFSQESKAVVLFCYTDRYNNDDNKHNLLVESVDGNCYAIDADVAVQIEAGQVSKFQVAKGKPISFTLDGVGPGFRWTPGEVLMISCPLVFSVEKLTRSHFVGLKASAGLLVGPDVGVFVNKRLGVCALTAIGNVYGFGVSASALDFNI